MKKTYDIITCRCGSNYPYGIHHAAADEQSVAGAVSERYTAFTARVSAAQSVLYVPDARTERRSARHARAAAILLCRIRLGYSDVPRCRTTAAGFVGRADCFRICAADWHFAKPYPIHPVRLSAMRRNRPTANIAHSVTRLSVVSVHRAVPAVFPSRLV